VVLFCDLVDSTALMTAIGDDAADSVRRQLFPGLRRGVEESGGSVVKMTGDGLMATFRSSAVDAVRCADALHAAAQRVDSPTPLRLRVGISAGEALEEDGDWYGTPVVEAARLCSAADPEEVLLSGTARDLIGSRGDHDFTAVGRLSLKGLGAPLTTYALGARARRRRPRSTRRWVALAVTVALVVAAGIVALVATGGGAHPNGAAAVPAPRGYTPRLTDRQCSPDESAGDPTVRCQTLTVPEDRSAPGRRTVGLAVVRAPAKGRGAVDTPTIVMGAPVGEAASDPLRVASDEISLAVRGRVGATPDLSCPELDASRGARFAEGWRAARQDLGKGIDACLSRLKASGIELRQYDEAHAADDVRDLAFALGLRRVNLEMFADSSRIAVALMHRSPGLLRTVLLASPLVPPMSAVDEVPNASEAALSMLAQRCHADPACAAITPDLVGEIETLRERLAARPVTVTVPDAQGRPTPVLMDDGRLMLAVSLALGLGPPTVGLVPSVVRAANLRSAAALLLLNGAVVDTKPSYIVEWCAEDAGIATPTAIQGQADAQPRWEGLIDPNVLQRCARFGLRRVADVATPPTSDVPVFTVTGALIPFVPVSAFPQFAAGLSHFRLLTLSFSGTGPDGWPGCVEELRARFVRDPSASLATTACAATEQPVHFVSS
jgi:class 3 adenylate cyclase